MKTQVDSHRMPYKLRNHWPNALAGLRHIGASMVIVTAVGSAAAAPPAEPVGLITELAGVGSVSQKPDGGALEPLRELMQGAVVSLASAARATVVHTPTGTVYELSGPGRFQVQARSIEPLNGAKLSKRGLPPELRAFQLKPLSTMQASIVMRGAAPLRLEGPNGGVLATDELTYRVRGNLTVQTVEVTDPESSDAWPVSNAGASFVVGVDTGLLHLAAALAVPLDGIFVGSERALTGPVGAGPIAIVGARNAAPSVEEAIAAVEKITTAAVPPVASPSPTPEPK